jgi:hypothetical protein
MYTQKATILVAFIFVIFANSLLDISGIAVPIKPEQKREVPQPQQDCYEQCKQEGKSSTSCETHCTVLTPMERHVTAPLDADCVRECMGGEVTGDNPLKPECEQKCPYKEVRTKSVKRRGTGISIHMKLLQLKNFFLKISKTSENAGFGGFKKFFHFYFSRIQKFTTKNQ